MHDNQHASSDQQGVGGQSSSGVPAQGAADVGASEPLGRSGLHHWRESTITKAGLEDRGDVFFAAIEMTRMPMILTDPNLPDGPIVFANKAFLDLTGYEEDEIVGRNCRFLQGAQTDRESVAELREAVAKHESIALEILNYRRDGSPFWNAVFIGPVYDTQGKLLYFFASQLDVTRRRNTEQSLRQAQKMESIGQLTAGLAHDFNNLLQVVNGNLELLAARTEEPRSRRYLESARGAAERGARLTRQLLAFARKSRLEPKVVDLTDLVNGFVEVIESSVGTDVALHLSLRRGLPGVLVDPDQLEMALLNIVINARDAMRDGGEVTIATKTLSLTEEEAGQALSAGEYVALEVIDQGEGMPPEVAERATEPFFTTKPVGKGTGLGLAMASGFARQSRGRLEIDSQLGRGATVRMLFPAKAVADPSSLEQDPAPEYGPATANLEESRVEHILIVEDSAEVLELSEEILTAAGYRVSTAITGDDGLRVFEAMAGEDRVHLVFTDLVMPGSMNGLTLADAVRERDANVSILLTTGYNEELVASDHRRRASDVLSKPYKRSELLDRVRQALNRHGENRARRRPSDFGAVEA